jgi:hypothetical protein
MFHHIESCFNTFRHVSTGHTDNDLVHAGQLRPKPAALRPPVTHGHQPSREPPGADFMNLHFGRKTFRAKFFFLESWTKYQQIITYVKIVQQTII